MYHNLFNYDLIYGHLVCYQFNNMIYNSLVNILYLHPSSNLWLLLWIDSYRENACQRGRTY